jgi:pyruvate/2-oxoglutarate dehydrogenase complex dihydrolipoamide acyltransferase (E2) component
MGFLRPPYWSWRHDRLKLVITVVLAALALFLALRPPAAIVAPTITAPMAGTVLDPTAPGEMEGTAAPGAVVAVFDGETIQQHRRVHLGFAVDTPRGLLVPVIRDAQALTLKQISARARALAAAAQDGRIAPDDLQGGTFSVTNLGSFGIDTFTPILNPPQVAILGVGGIAPRPIQAGEAIQFIPHLALSLTIDHRVIDGAPGARFLQTVGRLLAAIDLILAG